MHRKRSKIGNYGDCNQWTSKGHCSRRDSCSFKHDRNKKRTVKGKSSRSQSEATRHSKGEGKGDITGKKRPERYQSVRKVNETVRNGPPSVLGPPGVPRPDNDKSQQLVRRESPLSPNSALVAQDWLSPLGSAMNPLEHRPLRQAMFSKNLSSSIRTLSGESGLDVGRYRRLVRFHTEVLDDSLGMAWITSKTEPMRTPSQDSRQVSFFQIAPVLV